MSQHARDPDLRPPKGRPGAGAGAGAAPRGMARPRTPFDSAGAPGGVLSRNKPWESGAVQSLASKLGKDKDVVPMMVEGPTGCILASVGHQVDQDIASKALTKCHEKRLQRALDARAAPAGPSAPATNAHAANAERRLQPRQQRHGPAFGAVYEHKVNGVPKYVGVTHTLPEERFRLDAQQHTEVDRILQRQGGTSEVVWAGIGQGVVGAAEMSDICNTIQNERAERQQVRKLGGVKPYSRHG